MFIFKFHLDLKEILGNASETSIKNARVLQTSRQSLENNYRSVLGICIRLRMKLVFTR